jgi:hypothetical protein
MLILSMYLRHGGFFVTQGEGLTQRIGNVSRKMAMYGDFIPPLNFTELFDIKQGYNYYMYDVDHDQLDAKDVHHLLRFIGNLLIEVEYQRSLVSGLKGDVKKLYTSVDQIKEGVNEIKKKRKWIQNDENTAGSKR